mmetsp:Transcript_41450/g.75100  ORF Transcript_41450/g.75100 Transcript_41450/m.75100 type:complete len:230 (-) Transcript_41450:46-735(-)
MGCIPFKKVMQPATYEGVMSQLPEDSWRISLFGSTEFHHAESRPLCAAIGKELAERLGTKVVLLTGGNAVVHEVISRSFHEELKAQNAKLVYHLIPEGYMCPFAFGTKLKAGRDMEERREILARCAQVGIAVEGGPGTMDEMVRALGHGATLVPLARSGGASKGICEQLKEKVKVPDCVSDDTWALLSDETVDVQTTASAVAEIALAVLSGQESESASVANGSRRQLTS